MSVEVHAEASMNLLNISLLRSAIVVATLTFGCGGGVARLGPPRPMPPGATWTGCWETTFGAMQLRDDGGQIKGVYAYRSTLGLLQEKSRDGNQLLLEWVETQDGSTATGRGNALFALADDGQSFIGHWGRGASDSDGGNWEGDRKPCK